MSLSQSVAKVPISVVIPVLGSAVRAKRAVSRILNCRPLPSEIIIHCNGVRDFDEAAESAYFQGSAVPVHIQGSVENLGPGGARHAMIHAACGEFVASFDDDSWPLDEDYFARAVAVMEAQPKAAVLSPVVYVVEKPPMPPLAEVNVVCSFEGSASLIRRAVYLGLPGYVPVPSSYGVEESDIALQMDEAGWEILSCPWLRAWHDRPWRDYAHSILPWICNEILLVYLRFPRWMQLWGWWRALHRIYRHRGDLPLGVMLQALARVPAQLPRWRPWVRRISARSIWRHHCRRSQRRLIHPTSADGLRVQPAPPSPRVLFLQYTNPGGYPPIQHAALILSRDGWRVRVLGIKGRGTAQLALEPMPRVEVRLMASVGPGWLQKAHYLAYALIAGFEALRLRPHWIYASDPLSTPVALMLRLLPSVRILYHEHDSPSAKLQLGQGWFQRVVLSLRHRTIDQADLLVLPSEGRRAEISLFASGMARAHVVWNTPAIHEVVRAAPPPVNRRALRLLYHGSIVPARLGIFILEAMKHCEREVSLRVVGYFPPGAESYRERFLGEVKRLGLSHRVEFLGAMPMRSELLAQCADCDLGLCLLQHDVEDLNMRHMAGASNKAFDYLSQGLGLLVPNDPSWRRMFVDPGYAKPCDFGDIEGLAAILRELADHPDVLQKMGQLGRQKILEQWHYEAGFAPILEIINRDLHVD